MSANTNSKFLILFAVFFQSCVSGPGYQKTVEKIEIERFMGSWYVVASRPTFLEEGAHNAVETYTLAENGTDIDIDFRFNQDSFDGPIKSIPQSGWIENKTSYSHWKVSPFWPLSFDYLIIAIDPEYSWTAIGVPNQKYLWILARRSEMPDEELSEILSNLKNDGYDVSDVKTIPHNN